MKVPVNPALQYNQYRYGYRDPYEWHEGATHILLFCYEADKADGQKIWSLTCHFGRGLNHLHKRGL